MEGVTEKVQSICLNINQYTGETYEMRHMFDEADGLLDLCAGLLPTDLVQRNKEFDSRQNGHTIMAGYVNKCVEENVDGIDELIVRTFGLSKDEGIYLWGAGNLGIPLAHYLRKRGVIINGIIDNKFYEKQIEGYDIIPFEKVADNVKIFISVVAKEANVAIENQILEKYPEALIVKYQDLYEKSSKRWRDSN